MKTKVWLVAGLIFMNACPLYLAWAGNGADHGGGGDQVTLEAMLPKTVAQRLTYKYTQRYVGPYVEKTRCDLVLSCYQSADQIVVDTQMTLMVDSLPHYEPLLIRAYYLLGGEWRTMQSQFNDYLHPEIWVFGNPEKPGEKGAGKWTPTFEIPAPFGVQNDVTVDGSRETLADRIHRIRDTLFAQADYNSISEMKKFILEMEQARGALKHLEFFLNWPFSSGALHNPNADYDYAPQFHARMESDSQRLLELGQSAINPQDGTCDAQKYQRLLAELKVWTVGNPAYFYHLGKDNPFTADQQIAAMGVRQSLRESLGKEVVPYCEAQSSGTQSQVDLILNND